MITQTILITGAGSGFGRDTALTLAREGHRVYASMRESTGRNRDKAESLASEAAKETLPLKIIELDVTSTESVNRAVTGVADEAGRIDVLINNAGGLIAGVSEGFTDAQVARQFDVNVVGVQRMLRAVLPHMRTQKDGLVINIGSGVDTSIKDLIRVVLDVTNRLATDARRLLRDSAIPSALICEPLLRP